MFLVTSFLAVHKITLTKNMLELFVVFTLMWCYQGYLHGTIVRKINKHVSILQSCSDGNNILKRVDKWACVKNCGACCKLGPIDSRPDLSSYLSEIDYAYYESLIGHDDWCKNFDKENRLCKIYETRPEFCRVEPANFKKMFNIDAEDFNASFLLHLRLLRCPFKLTPALSPILSFQDFCTFCCREQIEDVYGGESDELNRFEDVIEGLG